MGSVRVGGTGDTDGTDPEDVTGGNTSAGCFRLSTSLDKLANSRRRRRDFWRVPRAASQVTDASGEYRFDQLGSLSEYRITVEAPGFQDKELQQVV